MIKKYLKIICSICIIMICSFATVSCIESNSKSEYSQGKVCKKCHKQIPDDDKPNNLGYCKDCYYDFYKETMNEMRRDGELK